MSYTSELTWPARAVVTAGMPYGNKKLHFGHVAGVFVPADAYARFLRDRIGEQNVLFVSGTDCFGSPIQEGYRKACENEGFEGTIVDYVRRNHDAQKATLDAYDISLSIYEGSGIGRAGEVHQRVTNDLLEKLHENGHLRLMETLQFYDPEAGQFLNGRQVHGYCPVQGCKSEKAYADECDLGHQFDPADLIKPTSSLTGCVPELRPVRNWYFDLPNFREQLGEIAENLARHDHQGAAIESLTVREREVLEAMAQGLSNSDIAAQLYLSEAGVSKHIASVFQKLGFDAAEPNRRVKAILQYLAYTYQRPL